MHEPCHSPPSGGGGGGGGGARRGARGGIDWGGDSFKDLLLFIFLYFIYVAQKT